MTEAKEGQKPLSPIRRKLHELVFESDTVAGRVFDGILIFLIVLSASAVILESIPSFGERYHIEFLRLEWIFTAIFTLEYVLRVISLRKPWRYVKSFFGCIDLLSIIPLYLSFIVPGAQALTVVRLLRLLRLFRLLKMVRYIRAAETLRLAFKLSYPKIVVFLLSVFSIVVLIGAIFYLVEVDANPKVSNIPDGIYWGISTITTVGYGDIVAVTPLGKLIASLLMIIGFGVFAVPTGIISVQLAKSMQSSSASGQACSSCGRAGHDVDALFCKYCGGKI